MDLPERIWADPPTTFDELDVWYASPHGEAVEYIRADAVARLVQEAVERERRPAIKIAASLNAAISLLERGGKKAAPSDKMFRQVLLDFHKALDDWRAAIRKGGAE